MGGRSRQRVDAGGSGAPAPARAAPADQHGSAYGNAAWLEDMFGVQAAEVPVLAELGSEILATFGPAITGWTQEQPPSLGTAASDAESDLQLARTQLADRFTVLTPEQAKKNRKNRAPNEVTAEEFDAVARQFSGIRRGTTDLRFADGEDQAFRDGSMNDIAALLQTASGRRLVSGLTNNVDEKKKGVHRETELRRPRDGVARTVPQESLGDHAVRNAGDPRVAVPGTDMRVDYVPGQITQGNGFEVGASWRSDVTLFHELTHALRGTHGRQHGTSQDEEEFETVGFSNRPLAKNNPLRGLDENAYRAERARIGEGTVGVIEGDRGMPRRTAYSARGKEPEAHRH